MVPNFQLQYQRPTSTHPWCRANEKESNCYFIILALWERYSPFPLLHLRSRQGTTVVPHPAHKNITTLIIGRHRHHNLITCSTLFRSPLMTLFHYALAFFACYHFSHQATYSPFPCSLVTFVYFFSFIPSSILKCTTPTRVEWNMLPWFTHNSTHGPLWLTLALQLTPFSHTYLFMGIHMCTFDCMCTCMYICTCVYSYTKTCLCVSIGIFVHAHLHAYIHE